MFDRVSSAEGHGFKEVGRVEWLADFSLAYLGADMYRHWRVYSDETVNVESKSKLTFCVKYLLTSLSISRRSTPSVKSLP